MPMILKAIFIVSCASFHSCHTLRLSTSQVPRTRLSVKAESARGCLLGLNEAIWKHASEAYAIPAVMPDPKRGEVGVCEQYSTNSSTPLKFLPDYVLHPTNGADPERDFPPPGPVNFQGMRRGIATQTIHEEYQPGRTLPVLEWTTAYSFSTDSSTFPHLPGYVGVFAPEDCERDACYAEDNSWVVPARYESVCTKDSSELELDKDLVFNAGRLTEQSANGNTGICSLIYKQNSDRLVFLKSDTCQLKLQAVLELSCESSALPASWFDDAYDGITASCPADFCSSETDPINLESLSGEKVLVSSRLGNAKHCFELKTLFRAISTKAEDPLRSGPYELNSMKEEMEANFRADEGLGACIMP